MSFLDENMVVTDDPNKAAASDGKFNLDINTNFSVLGFEQKGRISKDWSYNASPHIRYTIVKNKFPTIPSTSEKIVTSAPLLLRVKLPFRSKRRSFFPPCLLAPSDM